MPKLHLSIHVDQNGLQTINSDGDPSLWPLVGRLAACHSQAKMLALFAVLDSGGAQAPATKTEAPPAREQGPADETAARIDDAIGNYGTALMALGWSSKVRNVVDWARAFAAEHGALEEQLDLIDAILRPVVAAGDGDSCTDLAGLARGELVAVREELQATRAVLEEAIGRTPDPSRSTRQLAIDLAEVLKAAIASR